MTDLPKRGDRVLITRLGGWSVLAVGDIRVLDNNAQRTRANWVFFQSLDANGRVRNSGPAQVQILKRASHPNIGSTLESFMLENDPDFKRGYEAGLSRGLELAKEQAWVTLCSDDMCSAFIDWNDADEAVAKVSK